VQAPQAGTITKFLVELDETVKVGAPVFTMTPGGEAPDKKEEKPKKEDKPKKEGTPKKQDKPSSSEPKKAEPKKEEPKKAPAPKPCTPETRHASVLPIAFSCFTYPLHTHTHPCPTLHSCGCADRRRDSRKS
jgi:2-oxoglutarate dehydrogenase E2 component (dihydrolipoamide succinyltransferase)